jgi:hypothetical protein
MVNISDTLNGYSNHLHIDLWTSTRKEHYSEHLLPFLRQHMETGTSLQLELIDLHCNDEVRSKFKAGILHKSYKAHPKEKYPDL